MIKEALVYKAKLIELILKRKLRLNYLYFVCSYIITIMHKINLHSLLLILL